MVKEDRPHCSERAFTLVAGHDRATASRIRHRAAIEFLGHQSRSLRAKLRQLERAWNEISDIHVAINIL